MPQIHVKAGHGSWHLVPKAGAPQGPQPNQEVSKEDGRRKPTKQEIALSAHSTLSTDAQHRQHHWLSGGDVEFHTQNSITSVKKA